MFDEEPRSLQSVCDLITDGSHFSPTPQKDGYVIVNAKDIPNGRINLETCTKISKADWTTLKKQNCAPITGDVLLSKDGTIGRVVHYKSDQGVVVLSSIAILRPKTSVDASFLAQALRSDAFRQQLLVLESGSALKRIILKDIRRLAFSFPPEKPEQEKIGEILLTVDRAIEQTEALISKQQRIKTGLMQDLLTRGIDKRGNVRSEKTHEFKGSPLGRIPIEWTVTPANELCEAVLDCKNRTPPEAAGGQHPVIRTPNVRTGEFVYEQLAFTDRQSYETWVARGKPRPGDVVITREAPFGEACQIPEDMIAACLGQRMMMYQTNAAKLRPDYLVYAIYSEAVQKRLVELAGGSTVGHIRVGDIRRLPIPHPISTGEQTKIAGVLAASSAALKDLARCLHKLASLKTSLMQDLLTGEKRVTCLLETEPQREKAYASQ